MSNDNKNDLLAALGGLRDAFYSGVNINGEDIDVTRNADAAMVVETFILFIDKWQKEHNMAIKNSTMLGDTALNVVAALPCDVYLGGSRRMAEKFSGIVVGANTDYDFYCDYTPEIEDLLAAKGFRQSSNHEYLYDDECITILARDNVQVCLRKDAQFYERVFENISEEVYYNLLWKSSPVANESFDPAQICSIFNTLFAIGRAFEK